MKLLRIFSEWLWDKTHPEQVTKKDLKKLGGSFTGVSNTEYYRVVANPKFPTLTDRDK